MKADDLKKGAVVAFDPNKHFGNDSPKYRRSPFGAPLSGHLVEPVRIAEPAACGFEGALRSSAARPCPKCGAGDPETPRGHVTGVRVERLTGPSAGELWLVSRRTLLCPWSAWKENAWWPKKS